MIETPSDLALERRLTDIHAALSELIETHRPEAVAIEDLYFGRNVRSALAVGQARGVALLAAGQHGVPLLLLHAAADQGRGLRLGPRRQAAVQRMVGALLSLPAPPEPDHAADALAVALCHANGAPLRAALAGAAG